MAIIPKNAPEVNFSELKENSQAFHGEVISQDEQGNHHQYIPHKVYDAQVSELAMGKPLSELTPSGWRYVLQDANGTYHVAEVGVNEVADEHIFSHVIAGQHVDNFLVVYTRLHNIEHVEANHYEINLLRVSPLYVIAIWLKGVDHDQEFFIPIPPCNSRFAPGKTYAYEEFSVILRDLALENIR